MNATPPLVHEPRAGSRPRVLAMANQKGGVGKTTTAINLGTALAAIGERVLIIDLDPQGNASTGLGIDRKSRVTSSYDMLVGVRALRDVIMPTAVPRLFIASSSMDLLGVELEIAGHEDRSYKLRNALRAYCDSSASHPEFRHLRRRGLPAFPQSSHDQRARRRGRRRRAAAVRILRPRRVVAALDHSRTGSAAR